MPTSRLANGLVHSSFGMKCLLPPGSFSLTSRLSKPGRRRSVARRASSASWREPNGAQQQQVTNDEFNNWFPHISPDGKWIVMISYGQDVRPEDHPYYKHCYLRLMPIEGGKPRVIAYVFGGQGTINVPSWSPDSTRVAFVSNTDNIR